MDFPSKTSHAGGAFPCPQSATRIRAIYQFVLALSSIAWTPIAVSAETFPDPEWERTTPESVGLDAALIERAVAYAQSSKRDPGSGYITRQGKLVAAWGEPDKTYDLKSSSKSIGATALALAVGDGLLALDDRATRYLPSLGTEPASNLDTGWLDKITVRHLADQTAGFAKPGGYTKLLFEPGTAWHYSDGGPNHLADVLTAVHKRDLESLLFERVFSHIGITANDLRWRPHQYRERELGLVKRCELGSGVHANVDAMARLGLLYLRRGKWKDKQLLPSDYIDMAGATQPHMQRLPVFPQSEADGENFSAKYAGATGHYSLLWWNNHDASIPEAPRDAYWSWGLYDSLIVIIPSLDIVAARAGRSWPRKDDNDHYQPLRPFIGEIARAAGYQPDAQPNPPAPYPPSRVITGITWAPASAITRHAKGSDNWPATWADDDRLYSAYGDGWGFEPMVEEKLSMGLVTVTGIPPDHKGVNLRSPSAERHGAGARGLKASGILCVNARLYMWIRNAGNSWLAQSADHGKTWEYADWKFTTSFGAPTFLNFGQNYTGARDGYAYIYSLDSETAYDPGDGFVLGRVPQDALLDRSAYQFFVRLDTNNRPVWTDDIHRRGNVFSNPGRAYRSGITYNAALKRYLWVQVLPESLHDQGPRFEGGFGVYEAPEPWGPWSTVYFTNHWDVGPGETASFPTKWMSEDGRTAHLLFSGDDHFSTRRAVFHTNTEP